MISVDVFYDEAQQIRSVELTGHADYSEQGTDIICAATTALATSTIISLKELLNLKSLEYTLEDGHIIITLPDCKQMTANQCDNAELLMKSLKLGLMSIQESYGNTYLQLIEWYEKCDTTQS